MRTVILLFSFVLFGAAASVAQAVSIGQLRPGDLIFQNLDCGPMCDAIEAVTEGYGGHDFSHVAMVIKQGDCIMVIEAMGPGVRMVSITSFAGRTKNDMYVGRLKKQYQHLTTAAIKFAIQQLGLPYDDAFIYGNGKYYCSELVYDAFLKANNNQPFFTLYPMTYKQPGSETFFPVWVDYYRQLKVAIPEGQPGCNPGGLSRSHNIDIIGTLNIR